MLSLITIKTNIKYIKENHNRSTHIIYIDFYTDCIPRLYTYMHSRLFYFYDNVSKIYDGCKSVRQGDTRVVLLFGLLSRVLSHTTP
jgi:hypothetical protein